MRKINNLETNGGLLKKLLIATTLAINPLTTENVAYSQNTYTPQQRRKLEDQALLNYIAGSLLSSGIIPARNPNDARVLHGLGHLNMTIGRVSEYHLRNESLRYIGDSISGKNRNSNKSNKRNNTRPNNSGMVWSFFCNYVEDFNRDGSIKLYDETIGAGKRVFKKSESLTVFVNSTRRDSLGKKLEVKILNPRGEEIYSFSNHFGKIPHGIWSEKLSVKNLIENYGKGTYAAVFYYDDKFWEAKSFELIDD